MEHQHTPSSLPPHGKVNAEALAKGYEPHDLKLRSIFVFVGVLAATLFVVLSVIYAIMMALAAYDRSGDPLASPVVVKLPAPYAPLQPSLGFYGNTDQDHKVLDSDDMLVMRQQTDEELNAPAGKTAAGRAHMPVDAAIEKAMPMLLTKAVIAPAAVTPFPAGSYEGHLGDQPIRKPEPGVLSNHMEDLNNQGN